MADAFDWKSLIEPGMAVGGSLLGSKMANGISKDQLKESARQFDVKNQQSVEARNLLMPTLQRHLGMSGPTPQFGAAPTNSFGNTPQKSGSGIGGKLLGAAGAASMIPGVGGMMGSLPVVGALGPAAPIAAGALLAKQILGKIGAGRRQADKLTNPGGIQSNFENALKDIATPGKYTPEQAQQLTQYVANDTAQKAAAFSQQGGDPRAVRQMLGGYGWNPTVAPIFQKYLGQLG